MSIEQKFEHQFAGSKQFYQQAVELFPSGVTHDLRYLKPCPLYFTRQLGAHKWDVDGNQFIDYWMGHGALLLGHSYPPMVAAVQQQVERSTHVGGCHELEITWAKQVLAMYPHAERIRFTGSGTEATLMALRLARMFTGKNKLLKFCGHFHGWHDAVSIGSDPPYDQPMIPGVAAAVGSQTVAIMPNNLEVLEQTLQQDTDIAAIILEPTGGHWGAVPIRGDFLHGVRQLATKYGVLLIFDEVITGFRVAPAGAQQYYEVKPDLTSLAKILAGGLPGGALIGRADLLEQITFRPGKPKMRHPGTYNANPLSAAAGLAVLKSIAHEPICETANENGRLLRNQLNELFQRHHWPWLAYGDFSMFRLLPNYQGPSIPAATTTNDGIVPYNGDLNLLDGPGNPDLKHRFRQALLLNGVDMPVLGGWLSLLHTSEIIAQTVEAVERAIMMLNAN
ncbi:MAG: aminotransferase class III-fold pyridoxal phosphate-dependent enzyme [Zavarzinella sp.]